MSLHYQARPDQLSGITWFVPEIQQFLTGSILLQTRPLITGPCLLEPPSPLELEPIASPSTSHPMPSPVIWRSPDPMSAVSDPLHPLSQYLSTSSLMKQIPFQVSTRYAEVPMELPISFHLSLQRMTMCGRSLPVQPLYPAGIHPVSWLTFQILPPRELFRFMPATIVGQDHHPRLFSSLL